VLPIVCLLLGKVELSTFGCNHFLCPFFFFVSFFFFFPLPRGGACKEEPETGKKELFVFMLHNRTHATF
jgi:hypothetical protein